MLTCATDNTILELPPSMNSKTRLSSVGRASSRYHRSLSFSISFQSSASKYKLLQLWEKPITSSSPEWFERALPLCSIAEALLLLLPTLHCTSWPHSPAAPTKDSQYSADLSASSVTQSLASLCLTRGGGGPLSVTTTTPHLTVQVAGSGGNPCLRVPLVFPNLVFPSFTPVCVGMCECVSAAV